MLVMRVEFLPMPDMDDYAIAALAADNLVAMTSLSGPMFVASVLGHDMYAHATSTRESVMKAWQEGVEKGQASAYVCEHCLASSQKDLWGPGRITCPRCGKMAKTADGTPRP
jgi:uncharacterized paraquat-inducible protein A